MHHLATNENELKLDPAKIPEHVAIIMDGNRRWASQNGVPTMVGHWKGAEALTRIVEAASNLGIKVLTVYAFSTENWRRSKDEVDSIMHLFKMYLSGQKERMARQGVRLDTIGDVPQLPEDLREVLEQAKRETAHGKKIDLVLAMNYGARDDIRRAAVSIVEECLSGRLKKEEISEAVIAGHLDTAKWGDPQLLIRTSGEKRLSNFLLWQISYAEVYITDVLWPDFGEAELVHAILEFQRRKRRIGG